MFFEHTVRVISYHVEVQPIFRTGDWFILSHADIRIFYARTSFVAGPSNNSNKEAFRTSGTVDALCLQKCDDRKSVDHDEAAMANVWMKPLGLWCAANTNADV